MALLLLIIILVVITAGDNSRITFYDIFYLVSRPPFMGKAGMIAGR